MKSKAKGGQYARNGGSVSPEYPKAQHRRNILPLLNNRSPGSVERKHMNISAVLIENGLPYISGYKPYHNYQSLLKEEIEEYLSNHPNLFSLFDKYIESDISYPEISEILKAEIMDPEFGTQVKEPETKFNTENSEQNYYLKELRNKKLGLLGERFVLSFEKQKLLSIDRKDLSKKIEHISQTVGDSAGFYILSFNEEGKEKHIEVKTTQMGKNAPFYFTRNELNFSMNYQESYSLYRLFDFRKKPRFFQLKGSLDKSTNNVATEYLGWPK
ncbi:MAG: DUF3883 domain-containing protein [Balneolaceae bacterium]|nr:DUF3883 domain-containing protein [Balneolaceae bacterium]